MFLRGLSALFFIVGIPIAAMAHPHVWVDVHAELSVSAGYVEGVWTTWTFDEVFSQLILSDFPAGSDGKLDSKTLEAVKKGYFDNLKTYQYFSHIDLGKRSLAIPPPQKFEANVNTQGRISYRFYLPLGLRLDAKTPLSVSFYDDTFFTDMVFQKKEPVTLSVTDGGKATVSLRPDKTKTFYGGQITPTFAVIQWAP